jgi:hypothetical protein
MAPQSSPLLVGHALMNVANERASRISAQTKRTAIRGCGSCCGYGYGGGPVIMIRAMTTISIAPVRGHNGHVVYFQLARVCN